MRRIISAGWSIIALLLLQTFVAGGAPAATGDPVAPTTRVADLTGLYEFDLSTYGLGSLVVEIFFKDGKLWGRTGAKSDPFVLEPVTSAVNTFRAAVAGDGTYVLEFATDDRGQGRQIHLTNENLKIETTGGRLAAGDRFTALRQRLLAAPEGAATGLALEGVRLAVYYDAGMDANSTLALGRACQSAGCLVDLVDAEMIRNGELARFDLLAIPGGEQDPDPWHDLGREGQEEVRRFVAAGGGYIGICLGAVYASTSGVFWDAPMGDARTYLGLVAGEARCGQPEIAPRGSWPVMTEIVIADPAHPITRGLPRRFEAVMYPNGPYLQPHDADSVTVLAEFVDTGRPAMVACGYGKGRVFLSGPHPEIDVTSDRDGSSMFENLEDSESEWPLLLAALRWLAGR